MKKIIMLLICLVLFAACGGGGDEQPATSNNGQPTATTDETPAVDTPANNTADLPDYQDSYDDERFIMLGKDEYKGDYILADIDSSNCDELLGFEFPEKIRIDTLTSSGIGIHTTEADFIYTVFPIEADMYAFADTDDYAANGVAVFSQNLTSSSTEATIDAVVFGLVDDGIACKEYYFRANAYDYTSITMK